MSQPTTPQTCFICRKHRGEIESPGGAVYEDDLVFAGHAFIPDGKDAAYLGMLLLEPKRHAANWSDLTDFQIFNTDSSAIFDDLRTRLAAYPAYLKSILVQIS